MPNAVKLQSSKGTHPVDENLRPLKNGDKSSSLELAQHGNGARINGDLLVTGAVPSDDTKLPISGGTMTGDITTDSNIVSTDLTIDDSGDITLDAAGGDVTILQADLTIPVDKKVIFGNTGEYIVGDDTDLDIVSSNDATINAGGTIILDSADGTFEMLGAGTTAKFADMYAGMMLGCTNVFGSGTDGVFLSISTSFANLVWDTDKFALVTFVVPPSNKVKISVQLPYVQTSGQTVYLGLATDDSATTLKAKFEDYVWDVDETDIVGINYSWILDGSDSGMAGGAWSAGDTKTIYIMAKSTGTIRFYTGGTNTLFKGSVIVEATAIPATIADGSEP